MKPDVEGAVADTARHRWVIRFSVDGDVRFISHHDTLRLFRRALARAELPVRFSEGFSPHPRLSIPLPRSVGLASDDEAVVVEFERAIEPGDALRRLQREMPEGFRIFEGRPLQTGENLHPQRVHYTLELSEPPGEEIAARAGYLLDQSTLPVARPDPRGGRAKSVDLRPYLAALRVTGARIDFVLNVTGEGTAKPAEIAGLLGLDGSTLLHRIRRTKVNWKEDDQVSS